MNVNIRRFCAKATDNAPIGVARGTSVVLDAECDTQELGRFADGKNELRLVRGERRCEGGDVTIGISSVKRKATKTTEEGRGSVGADKHGRWDVQETTVKERTLWSEEAENAEESYGTRMGQHSGSRAVLIVLQRASQRHAAGARSGTLRDGRPAL